MVFKETNIVHLAKLAWRFMKQPSNLWVEVLKKKYGTLANWSEGLKYRICLDTWKDILKGYDILKKGLSSMMETFASNHLW